MDESSQMLASFRLQTSQLAEIGDKILERLDIVDQKQTQQAELDEMPAENFQSSVEQHQKELVKMITQHEEFKESWMTRPNADL